MPTSTLTSAHNINNLPDLFGTPVHKIPYQSLKPQLFILTPTTGFLGLLLSIYRPHRYEHYFKRYFYFFFLTFIATHSDSLTYRQR